MNSTAKIWLVIALATSAVLCMAETKATYRDAPLVRLDDRALDRLVPRQPRRQFAVCRRARAGAWRP